MVEARRGHALAGVKITAASTYLYAIGGDDGDMANAKSSVEVAQVSKQGELAPFYQLGPQSQLPTGVTFGTGQRIGEFLYYAGGRRSDGSNSNEVRRAHILSPFQTGYHPL